MKRIHPILELASLVPLLERISPRTEHTKLKMCIWHWTQSVFTKCGHPLSAPQKGRVSSHEAPWTAETDAASGAPNTTCKYCNGLTENHQDHIYYTAAAQSQREDVEYTYLDGWCSRQDCIAARNEMLNQQRLDQFDHDYDKNRAAWNPYNYGRRR
ncbi:hypothetical protein K466DRAFT_192007 [Polyporus arcularius HHB13444]|uniref:Uncharacterized protein n=1 Tax=Polyporus arcularius HHB13444 TaxID=1314778 RepID=A0A5C3P6K5_9APHY|nr:hypothetical protein K466DRAFT_192007 [Polyporus arcularius HHB13444]